MERNLENEEIETTPILTITELEANALKFWPASITAVQANASIIPKLIETQDKFISLLNAADADPFAWKIALQASSLTTNLFLKHLMVLSDVGGEYVNRVHKEIPAIFNGDKMEFLWKEKKYEYKYKSLNGKAWSNDVLGVDGKGLQSEPALSDVVEDVINFILYAGLATVESLPQDVEEKCMIGELIGMEEELNTFVRQRYIWVSRITGGATANDLGQLTQTYVRKYLEGKLNGWDFTRKTIPEVTQKGTTPMPFDIVAKSPSAKYCGIEVSFQVTTNSTIERKANEARGRKEIMHAKGHKIAYVIDGAGNFRRVSAITTIIKNSDCAVTFKDSDLDKLVNFLKSLEEKK